MDIERRLNNRPLAHVDSDGGSEKVLTPNSIMWRQQCHILKDSIVEEEKLSKFD